MKNNLRLNATMVANEFIDKYMAGANGEYVKVYLYILRHEGQVRDEGQIADDLNHTEADVRRAIGYWVRQGVLEEEQGFGKAGGPGRTESRNQETDRPDGAENRYIPVDRPDSTEKRYTPADRPGSIGSDFGRKEMSGSAERNDKTAAAPGDAGGIREKAETPVSGKQPRLSDENTKGVAAAPQTFQAPGSPRKTYTPEQVSRLAGQEDFTQLLYISQKYMNKIFTPRECEVFAYLYDGLHMSVELLEYLVEYCVQNGHCSIRYLESVAINWHEKGFRTVNEAKAYTAAFSKEGFAVMRAFGISDRRPGDSEQELIHKWFREFGFTRDIVLEACSRTLKAIHKPSFSYADKILTDWKKGGVRVIADIQRMDQLRDGRRGSKDAAVVKPSRNQFHNFEQRDTDYDAMVLERLKERLGDS